MQPTVKHLCGCRDPETKKILPRGTCPKLAKRTHGFYEWRVRVPKPYVALVGESEKKGREKSKKAADDAAQKAIGEILAGQRDVGGLTVGQYLDEWLEGKRRLRPSGRANYESNIRLYLRPLIGEVPLTGLRREHIDRMIRRIEEGNATRRRTVGPKTLAEIFGTLRTALNDAVAHRKIRFNPCQGVELPEYDPPEVEPWTPEEVGRFLDASAEDRLFALFELMALTGLRRGEAAGATWDGLVANAVTTEDDDGPSGILTITQQITDSGGAVRVSPPKTRSGKRRVDIDRYTFGSLMAHRLAQDQDRADVGPSWDNGTLPGNDGKPVHLTGLMFTRPDGRYLAPEFVTSHMWHIAKKVGLLCRTVRPAAAGATSLVVGNRHVDPMGTWTLYVDREPVAAVEVAECVRRRGSGATVTLAEPLPNALPAGAELGRDLLSKRRLHDLRHGSASIQLAEGIDITLVSKRLGHSSPHVTGRFYAHLLRPAGQAAATKVANAVPRATRRAHPVPIQGDDGGPAGSPSTGGGATTQVSGL